MILFRFLATAIPAPPLAALWRAPPSPPLEAALPRPPASLLLLCLRLRPDRGVVACGLPTTGCSRELGLLTECDGCDGWWRGLGAPPPGEGLVTDRDGLLGLVGRLGLTPIITVCVRVCVCACVCAGVWACACACARACVLSV